MKTNMKQPALVVTLFVAFATIILVVFWISAKRGQTMAYREMRNQLIADVKAAQQTGNVQLLEYVKARYYYYSNRAGVRLRRGEGDFGPVKKEALTGFSAGKDLTSFEAQYEEYRRLPGFKQ